MPEAPPIEIEGQPLLDTLIRAITEGIAGNGVLAPTDLEVTAGTGDLELDVSAGDVHLSGSQYSFGGAAPAVTLSAGDGTYDRWDTVVFDTATPGVEVHEGTPATNPTAPDIQSGEIALAIVYVASGATVIDGGDIVNIRTGISNESEDVHYNDSTGTYGISTVAAALDELQEAAQLSAYPLALATDTEASAYPLSLATDTEASAYPLSLATDTEASAYPLALADLASPFALPSITDMDAAGTDITDSTAGVTVWSASAGAVPQAQLGGPASSLSAYPLAHNTDTDAPADAHHTPPTTDTVTASGDGSTTVYTIAHSLGAIPSAVSITPTSADAAAEWYLSNKTSTDVEITFTTAPPSGTDNLSWEVITVP